MRVVLCALAAIAANVWYSTTSAEPSKWGAYRYIVSCSVENANLVSAQFSDWRAMIDSGESQERRLALIALAPGTRGRFYSAAGRAFDDEPEQAKFDLKYIEANYRCEASDPYTLLIGLDQSVKKIWRETRPGADEIYALVDSMPMRIREMRTKDGAD